MIKEEEIAWYRHNVINKYVDEVMKEINLNDNKGERINTYDNLIKKRAGK